MLSQRSESDWRDRSELLFRGQVGGWGGTEGQHMSTDVIMLARCAPPLPPFFSHTHTSIHMHIHEDTLSLIDIYTRADGRETGTRIGCEISSRW